jgi:hypothetical protein
MPSGSGEQHGGIGADRDRDRQRLPSFLRAMEMEPAALADLPVHAGRLRIEHVHAVDAEVARARVHVLGEHERKRDETSAVLRPEPEDRQRVEIRAERAGLRRRFVAHELGPVVQALRARGEHAPERAAPLPQIAEALRRQRVEDLLDLGADRARGAAERPLDAARGREHVHRERKLRAAHVLEQQCGAFGLRGAARDLRDFAVRVHLAAHPLEVAATLELAEELGQRAEAAHAGAFGGFGTRPMRASSAWKRGSARIGS